MKRPYDEQDSASEAGPNFMDNKKKRTRRPNLHMHTDWLKKKKK